MAIKTFIQGKSARSDRELFGLIGHWLIDKKVHKALGIAISADPDDIWYVSLTHKGEAKGFLNARIYINKNFRIRLVYADNDSPMRTKALIQRAINQARESGCRKVWTYDLESKTAWRKLGFTATAQKRSRYFRWVLELKEDLS